MGTDNIELLPMRAETIPGAARFLSAGRGITMPEPGRITVPHWITTEAEGRKAVQELAAQKVDIVENLGRYPRRQVQETVARTLRPDHRRGAQEQSAGCARTSSTWRMRKG